MEPLSQKLAELSVQAKNTEDRAKAARSEAGQRLDERREKIRDDSAAALAKVRDGLDRAGESARAHATQLKSKIASDFEQLKQRAGESHRKFAAREAEIRAEDMAADAEDAIDYAIASVKLAELAVLDAIDARITADTKADEIQPAQPMPA